MQRKLASIRRITDIQPIPNADAIEVVVVGGWKVVTKKGEFNVGDLCVYCEIDSFLPIFPQYEFLRKSSYKKLSTGEEGFRLRTIKLRGQVSQGLVLPLSVLPAGRELFDGMDVTEVLSIIKYEPPIPASLAGKVKGLFPSFLHKTDEERVQNLADEFGILHLFQPNKTYYVTEKLDGSSATFYFRNGEFGVCSRNLELLETPDNTFWKVARDLKIEEKLGTLDDNICLQGELIGEGIQGNQYKIKGQTVRFFNAYNIDTRTYLPLDSFKNLMNELDLEMVPILSEDFKFSSTIDELLKYAEEKSQLNPEFDREGVVIRSHDRTISFKVISNKFLLNEK
jgi:RNA ligase (TIGR02306 family)